MRRTLLPILILVLSACSSSSSDGPVLTFADFNNPPTTITPPEATSTTTSTSTFTTTTTTLLVLDAPNAISITSGEGFAILEGPGAPRRLVDRPVAAAFDDLQGGLVFQLPGAGTETDADQRIFWSRSTHPEAQPYLDVEEGSLLRLWGTETIGGSPQMILTIVDDADDPDARVERLVLFDFETGDRVLGEVGAADSGPVAIGYGSGRFVLEQRAGVQSFFEFRNDQGAVMDLASNPNPGCADDASCPAHPAIDPSGSFLAYLEGGTGGARDLVIHDLDLDEEVRRVSLSETGEVLEVDLDGAVAIVNRTAADGEVRAIIVDADAGTYGEFGLGGLVRFLRVGPEFDGSIDVPSN